MNHQMKRFQFNVDVKQNDKLYGMSGKTLYYGRFISNNSQCLIVEMNETIARHEGYFYQLLNGHRHIIRTFGSVDNTQNLTIYVQEFARFGDLANLLLNDTKGLTAAVFIEMFRQIADAMSYLAEKSVVHGDLGCRNILVYRFDSKTISNTLVKLTDFGLARSKENPSCVTADPSVIPIRYCAPEILRRNVHENYSEKSDVYSMGVTMWEAFSQGAIPYPSISSEDEVKQKKLRGETLTKPATCSAELWRLIEKCWPLDPNQRITFEQMKAALVQINTNETLPEPVTTTSARMPKLLEFRQETDFKIDGKLGDFLYSIQWISQAQRPSSVLLKLEKEPTEDEFRFYDLQLKHRNLVEMLGFVRNDPSTFLIIQERSPYGNLRTVLTQQNYRPSDHVLLRIFMQIVDVMIYLTDEKLVHGDLRCENLLVFQMDNNDPEKNLLKLTNFQSVQDISDQPKPIKRHSKISVRHCAPEILRSAGQGNYSDMSDVYSMGVLMWEVCSGGQQAFHSYALDGEVRQRKLNGERLEKPASCNTNIWKIMSDCWHNEPIIRFNFHDMMTRLKHVRLSSSLPYELNVHIQRGEYFSGSPNKTFYQAQWISPRPPKILLLTMDSRTAQQELQFYLKFSSHPHIIRTFGRVECHDPFVHIIQERAKHGDLLSFLLQTEPTWTDNVIIEIFLQIADAMSALRQEKIIHGDLRCANILICRINPNQPRETLVKLTNFHQAFEENSVTFAKRDFTAVLEQYGAIELLQDTSSSSYSTYSEAYSMGILMWQVYTRKNVPFDVTPGGATVRDRRLHGEVLSKPSDCRGPVWEIIRDCFHREPTLRFDFELITNRLKSIQSKLSLVAQPVLMHQRNNSAESMDSSGRRTTALPVSTTSTSSTSQNESNLLQRLKSFLSH